MMICPNCGNEGRSDATFCDDCGAAPVIQNIAGTVEVGKVADLVLIDYDPCSDPAALRNVWVVLKEGQRVL